MVSLVDEAVGNATAAWDAAGLSENGLTILSSDNGSPPDFRGLVGNLPLRGFKHQLWEGGLRKHTSNSHVACDLQAFLLTDCLWCSHTTLRRVIDLL